ncbi:GNAT family N-acetyltransferase [Shewanella surugensis]|uniref:GNAT family N-acetyltransferase n=1 Tax=Shewanella surugensis TaxID=212020 RepID=A0ABT0LEY9_9GAMM|nr:GNAT family N-acetyltransferase [Shewanella surugensis]MCL1126272.1 GNAT family N-acetyltransferase [Shewanella surugensis]
MIKVRHSQLSDLAAIKGIYEQEHAVSNTLQLPFQSDDLWEKRLTACSDNHINVVALIDNQVVGQLSLLVMDRPRRKHVATLGMGVSSVHTGKGVGSQLLIAALDLADNWLNIRRIELEVYQTNEAAICLYKKHGFVEEGLLRDYAFKNGGYVDALMMARLRT